MCCDVLSHIRHKLGFLHNVWTDGLSGTLGQKKEHSAAWGLVPGTGHIGDIFSGFP